MNLSIVIIIGLACLFGIIFVWVRKIIKDSEILPGHSFTLYQFENTDIPMIWRVWYAKINDHIFEEKSEIGLDEGTEFWRQIELQESIVEQIEEIRKIAVEKGYREVRSDDFSKLDIIMDIDDKSALEIQLDKFVDNIVDLLEDCHLGKVVDSNWQVNRLTIRCDVLHLARAERLIKEDCPDFFPNSDNFRIQFK